MAHPQQLLFIETLAQHLASDYSDVKILEIGSYIVNATIRDYFPKSQYCGADLIEGPGVDVVEGGHMLSHDNCTYDLTLSCECFEHNPYWFETFKNMHRMTKSGGYVVFTCATRGRREHGTRRTSPKSSPGSQDLGWDYYRNLTVKDFKNNLNLDILFDDHLFLVNTSSQDLYFIGKKYGNNDILRFDKEEFLRSYTSSQRELERNILSNISVLKRLVMYFLSAVSVRKKLAHLLPDRKYQNFLFLYDFYMEPVKRPIRKVLNKF